MKISILSVLLVLSMIVPISSLAQTQTDIDPNPDTSACVQLNYNLRYRSRDIYTNGEVSTLQDFLQSKGYLNSEPTGYFGLLTMAAARSFQGANGIQGDGYVGPITRARINAVSCSPATPFTPTRPNPCPPGAIYSYENGKPCNASKVNISGVSGPQTLNVNQQGTWKVTAYSTNGEDLSYSVYWGDEYVYAQSQSAMSFAPRSQQSATFTHSYLARGLYTPVFTVTNNIGQSAQTSLSVNVDLTTCSSAGYDTRTGFRCGCSSTSGYSSTTGEPCGDPSKPSVDLKLNGLDGPLAIDNNAVSTLSWTTTSIRTGRCWLDIPGSENAVPGDLYVNLPSGSIPVKDFTSGKFVITCSSTNDFSDVKNNPQDTVEVYVNPLKAPYLNFGVYHALPEVTVGQNYTANISFLSNIFSNVSLTGVYDTWMKVSLINTPTLQAIQISGTPPQSAEGNSSINFTLSANGVPNVTRTFPIVVNPSTQVSNCIINSFTASPSAITSGQSSTLSWDTSNCNALWISASSSLIGYYTLSGYLPITPAATTTYILNASPYADGHASITKSVTVTVSPPSSALTITTSSSLPNAKVGQAYYVTINTSGVDPSNGYNWSVDNRFPLIGFSFGPSYGNSINITGTPAKVYVAGVEQTVPYTFTFNVSVNSGPQTSTKQFTLTVDPAGSVQGVHISVGSWVSATTNLNVRSSAGIAGSVIQVQPAGTGGVIVGGPQVAEGHTWWSVDFTTGADGWVAGEYLK